MPERISLPVLVAVAVLVALALLAAASTGRSDETEGVKFTQRYLSDPANIELGHTVWSKRCKFCHGKMAYPGKAPKLEPGRYTPEFVYDRVTNGFRGMPSWKHEFSKEERMAVVAYVLSKDFSN